MSGVDSVASSGSRQGGWRTLGRLLAGRPPVAWAASHASVPLVKANGDGTFRLLFSSRDDQGRSHVGAATLDIERRLLGDYAWRPLLSPGELGAFDDSGTMASCLVERDGCEYLYYIGWSLGVTVPFYTFVGCALRQAGEEHFARVSAAPILGRTSTDPYFTTAPWVLVEGSTWRMWYAAGTGWDEHEDGPLHRYHIRYAESDDGLVWRREGVVCIDYADEDEFALTRPCVVRDDDGYKMWYSRRGHRYRLGYAQSHDGLVWERKDDELSIDVSPDGWDSEMIEYPCVFDHGDQRYLVYNGNGYGATGIGWALLDR
jgi:hypothetical protein